MKEKGTEGNYIFIPDYIARRTDLTPTAKMVYGVVQSFFGGKTHSSLETLSKRTGTSRSSIQRAIKELSGKRLIKQKYVKDFNDRTIGRILRVTKPQ